MWRKLLKKGWILLVLSVLCAECGNGDRQDETTLPQDAKNNAAAAVDVQPDPPANPRKIVKAPNVAGAFYPGDSSQLRNLVRSYLEAAKPSGIEEVWGLVAPHAGYMYSGPVAATSYRQVQGKRYGTVVVIAFNHNPFVLGHRDGYGAVATYDADAFRTPLGEVPVDRPSVRKLTEKYDFIRNEPTFFNREHSLETQLPFLQEALEPGWKLVPLFFGRQTPQQADRLAEALAETFGKRRDVLYVASTDWSHYHDYDTAVRLDRKGVEFVTNQDLEGFQHAANTQEIELCGQCPIRTMMQLNRRLGGGAPKVLDMRNSGDTAGDRSRVVGYASLVFHGYGKPQPEMAVVAKSDDPLSTVEKKALVRLARNSLEAAVKGGNPPEIPKEYGVLREPGAAFVTLTKGGHLRGCIGHVVARIPLGECVRDVARSAALHDRRFSPVTPDELADIAVEVSVLTPPVPIDDPQKVEVGRHGLVMQRGGRSGLLLPQVPVEWGWDRKTFLEQTCNKAGMERDCWKDSATSILTFTAIVFSETSLGLAK